MTKKMWGGRFSKATDPKVEEFTRSIQYDYKLAEYDLLGSMVHVEVLKRAGLLKAQEASRLQKALAAIHKSVADGKFKPDISSEDIHTEIQNRLEKKFGELALKLQTARSRNEQVAFSTRLYCIEKITELKDRVKALVSALGGAGDKNRNVIIPGFTHMQHGQPVLLKDYFDAYAKMLARDTARLDNILKGTTLAMGAGAVAGTPIDAAKYNVKLAAVAKGGLAPALKGLSVGPVANPMDAVSDRDFVIDILSALALVGMHLSRMAEDLIIWSTKEFDFVAIDDAFCTGSSLMPQKKNADTLELIRGYSGRLCGNLVSVLTMMKGLPLAYNRDMQLDKEPLFGSFAIAASELDVLADLVKGLRFNKQKIDGHLKDESLYATDLVYYLVGRGVAFKTAHAAVGRLVKYSYDNSVPIKDLTETELAKFSPRFVKKEIVKLFDPELSVRSKKSIKR